jgi:hypothetical protein
MTVADCALIQQEEDGVMTVKFRDPLSAKACVLVSALSPLTNIS